MKLLLDSERPRRSRFRFLKWCGHARQGRLVCKFANKSVTYFCDLPRTSRSKICGKFPHAQGERSRPRQTHRRPSASPGLRECNYAKAHCLATIPRHRRVDDRNSGAGADCVTGEALELGSAFPCAQLDASHI